MSGQTLPPSGPMNTGCISVWAAADLSAGFCFFWRDELGEPHNFNVTDILYGQPVSPDQFRITPFKRHRKPPREVIEWAIQYILTAAQKQTKPLRS